MSFDGISVVIPVFNRPSMVGIAVASALAQVPAPDEVIVVDDGSTDDTAAVVGELVRADPRVVLVRQANAGANVARNNGVERARCDWTAFLDSDDRWRPGKLAAQVAALAARPGAVASFTGTTSVNGERELFDYDTPADVSLFDLRRHNLLGGTSTAMIRRDVLRRIGGFRAGLPSCQDWDLWLRLRREGDFAIVQQSMVLYEEGPHERITANFAKAIAGHRAVFRDAISDVTSARDRRMIRASHLEVTSRLMQRHGMRGGAAVNAAASLVLAPSRATARTLYHSLF